MRCYFSRSQLLSVRGTENRARVFTLAQFVLRSYISLRYLCPAPDLRCPSPGYGLQRMSHALSN